MKVTQLAPFTHQPVLKVSIRNLELNQRFGQGQSGLETGFGGLGLNSTTAPSVAPTQGAAFATRAFSSTKIKKMGAKKTGAIDFDGAEKRAQLELARKESERAVIEQNQEAKKAARQQSSQDGFKAASPPWQAPREPAEKPPVVKLGFGFDPSNAPPPPVAAPVAKKGFGFGGMPDQGPAAPTETTTRFGNAKGISSDQYFNRRSFDTTAAPDTSHLQSSSGFGSSEYFGRESPAPNVGQMGPVTSLDGLKDGAQEFANQFSQQAQEDFDNVKRLVSFGTGKLSNILANLQVRVCLT